MAYDYPPVGFHFSVSFTGLEEDVETQFQSVSGLSVDMETEEFAEGGENRFKHKFPVKTKYPNLVLKRGMAVESELIQWCRDAMEGFEFAPKDLTIRLLNEKHEPLRTWNVVHAFPVKWAIDDFNAQESKLVIETLEFSYHYFKILD
ncbi:phage tail protein [Cyclobacterium jeungdonense]|uniref:Phage tail protein n=1 Tax=Cyclobacterium jeungdonense TaxID=708087 RepID=A0ABT8CDT4_9BACT|nr:phage tail protein [Cyclobacterium jeungdonense]MDN3689958.1 phage tail protein [Cyclobacterium jeungdonense]